MFTSRKKLKSIESRLAELEGKATAMTFRWGKVDLKDIAQMLEELTPDKRKPPAGTDGNAF